MAKSKFKAIVNVPDGIGGMALVRDRRFETGDWLIRFEVPNEEADTWLQYFWAECTKRGWSSGGIRQFEANENSGSHTISTGGPEQPQLTVVWERRRGGPIKVRARSGEPLKFPREQAEELFREVNERNRAGATERFLRGWHLSYNGLPWCGEVWLNETLRLGPPSQQDETASTGPRIILVNELINGIDWLQANSAFNLSLRELSVFLTVVMGINVRVSTNGTRGWTWKADSSGQAVECDVRNVEYWEKQWPLAMPTKGQVKSVPLLAVSRPDFSLRGIDGTWNEEPLPDDIVKLWQTFAALPAELRQQFLQVGSMYQLALSLGSEYETARFALMVAACEALKPADTKYWKHNIYHVVEALLGKVKSDLLQEHWFRPQDIRNAHFHRGELRGSEFARNIIMSSFHDPTFGEASRTLFKILQACIIEWLMCEGVFTMSSIEPRNTFRRWVRGHLTWLILIAVVVGIALGFFISWIINSNL